MQNFFFDLIPIFVFFIVYKFFGIYAATASAIILALLQSAYLWFFKKTIDKMQITTLILICLLGGATLIFHNPAFIKWKVSIIYWVFALVILGSQFIGPKNIVQRMLENQLSLPANIWRRLAWAWFGFFAIVGFLNVFVMLNYSTNTWVDFKLFGILGLTLLFFIIQGICLAKHLKHE